MVVENTSKKVVKEIRLNLVKKNQSAINLLDSLISGDENDQKETFDYLKKVLDEDRPSNRSLFT